MKEPIAMTPRRTVLLIAHTGRPEAVEVATAVCKRLMGSGITVRLPADEAKDLPVEGAEVIDPDGDAARECEIALVIGGDGTILRAAALTRTARTPLLGINLGHVGFLAEAEWDDVDSTVDAIIAALKREGVRCSGIEELDGAKLVRAGASCNVDGKPVVARTFASASKRDDWLKIGASFGSSVLVGPNWVIATNADDTAESLQEAIGGTLR